MSSIAKALVARVHVEAVVEVDRLEPDSRGADGLLGEAPIAPRGVTVTCGMALPAEGAMTLENENVFWFLPSD
jgi:hypothetical protein